MIKKTQANIFIIILAIIGTFTAAVFATYYTSERINHFGFYIVMVFVSAFILEILLRLLKNRQIKKQVASTSTKDDDEIKRKKELLFKLELPKDL